MPPRRKYTSKPVSQQKQPGRPPTLKAGKIAKYYTGPRVVCPYCEEAHREYHKPRAIGRSGPQRYHRCTHPDCLQAFLSFPVKIPRK